MPGRQGRERARVRAVAVLWSGGSELGPLEARSMLQAYHEAVLRLCALLSVIAVDGSPTLHADLKVCARASAAARSPCRRCCASSPGAEPPGHAHGPRK